ncbi:bicaudal D-related protein homolog isoform X2 [Mytilus californianus]|uniref:bicaudal D-related protein homolog isoform X2 n=1 Tax=Mytilus californianus TaxID=6549 RepID=UPI0022477DE8|nr:bicaudal D-related protein homolog isoform X2 [Mytilus californianus]
MCACHFEDDPSPSQFRLDIDNYYQLAEAMGDRRHSGDDEIPIQVVAGEEEDVYGQLAQKERDLVLAAELGKALLERNDELERRNEQIADEFAHKIEELQQEKYELHLKLEKTEVEYENTIKELQYDISQLRHELQTQQHYSDNGDKAATEKIRELTVQNERLKEEIRQSSVHEEGLVVEMQGLREQMLCRKSSMHFHISQLEVLQEEINLLSKRKCELEKRITLVTEERDGLASSHEEVQERILMLERTKRETEQKVQNRERDIIELQETNLQLQAQIHHLASRSSAHSSPISSHNQSQTLFNELSQLSPSNHESQPLTNELCQMSPSTPPPDFTSQYSSDYPMSLAEMMEEDEFECDDEDVSNVHRSHDLLTEFTEPQALTDSQFLSDFQDASQDYCTDYELKEELVNVYSHLKQLCKDCGKPVDKYPGGYKVGILSPLLQDLREVMQNMITHKSHFACTEVQTNLSDDEETMVTLHKQIGELRIDLVEAQNDLDRVKTELSERDSKLKTKTEELSHLTNKISILELTLQHEELSRLQAERDRLQDNTRSLSSDNLLQEARNDRDMAIEKQNKTEVELAKSKLDILSMNEQLMEAIQQKVALSQELDQWQVFFFQVDMQDLLDFQLKERIKEQSVKEQVLEQLKKHISMRKSKSTSFLSRTKPS